jgi:hypothetical protein
MAMQVSFVRHRERRDRVYVTRDDGSSTGWDFPSYGDRLPHDLCHLVVEEGLVIVEGFWGLVDRGVEVELVDNQATLERDGEPLVRQPGIDFSDLRRAEEAVALLGPPGMHIDEVGALAVARLDPSSTEAADGDSLRSGTGFGLPAGASDEAIASVRHRLLDLSGQWRALGDGDAITLTYTGRTTAQGR